MAIFPPIAPGSGGDGAFVLAAPGGVYFSGQIDLGRGRGAIYGAFYATGTLATGAAAIYPYSDWQALGGTDFSLVGGAGGGGAGGDGQILTPAPPAPTTRVPGGTPAGKGGPGYSVVLPAFAATGAASAAGPLDLAGLLELGVPHEPGIPQEASTTLGSTSLRQPAAAGLPAQFLDLGLSQPNAQDGPLVRSAARTGTGWSPLSQAVFSDLSWLELLSAQWGAGVA